MKTTNKVIMVEGVSDLAYLGALDHRIGDLSAQRTGFLSAAHELAHHVLDWDGANSTGMSSVLDALDLLRGFGRPAPTDWPTSLAAEGEPPVTILLSESRDETAHGLPLWTTSDFAGMLPGAWLGSSESVTGGRPQVTFRLSNDTRSFLRNIRTVLLRFIDTLLAMARLCLVQILLLAYERSLVLARRGRSLGTLAFVLAILAVCRRYGRRSEPDDHASLIIRRRLVSMGSCVLA